MKKRYEERLEEVTKELDTMTKQRDVAVQRAKEAMSAAAAQPTASAQPPASADVTTEVSEP